MAHSFSDDSAEYIISFCFFVNEILFLHIGAYLDD